MTHFAAGLRIVYGIFRTVTYYMDLMTRSSICIAPAASASMDGPGAIERYLAADLDNTTRMKVNLRKGFYILLECFEGRLGREEDRFVLEYINSIFLTTLHFPLPHTLVQHLLDT